jgi:uncharacterized membrane protein
MTGMVSAEHQVRIARPAEAVFDFLAGGANNPRWQPGVISSGQDGTVIRQSMRHPLGFRVPASYRLTRADRPRALAFEVISGGPIRPTGAYQLAPVGPDQTDVRFTMSYRLHGRRMVALPLVPWMRLRFRSQTSRIEGAKIVLESEQTSAR